jgi:putative FmdB family regulatory protein
MPVYDYRCEGCGKIYDVYHKGKEIVEDVVCPSCGSTSYKKLMSIPAIPIGSHAHADECPADGSCESGGCCGGACGLN